MSKLIKISLEGQFPSVPTSTFRATFSQIKRCRSRPLEALFL